MMIRVLVAYTIGWTVGVLVGWTAHQRKVARETLDAIRERFKRENTP